MAEATTENPFAQFAKKSQTPSTNPFEQFAPASTTSGIPGPRQNYNLADVPMQAIKNVPESAGKFVGGVIQAVTSPVETIGGILDVATGAARNLLPQGVVNFIDKFDKNPEATQRAVNAANAVGGMFKDRYGSYESIKRTFAEDPVGAAADLSTLLTGGGSAATKVGMARTGGALTKAGAVINPMAPIAPILEQPVKLAAKGVGAVYNALDPKAAAYLAAVEGRGQEVVNALRQPSEIVPGSLPTAAQAASPVGVTKFSALGESAANTSPTPFYKRGEEQKAAQIAAVQQVGKTPADLAAAEATRSSTASSLYGISKNTLVPADSTLTTLLERPSMNKVMARAEDLAKERGQPFQVGKNRPAETIPSTILDSSGNPIGSTQIPAEVAKYPGSSLHAMKMAFDDLIKNPERFGIGSAEVGAIKSTRSQFLNWVEDKAPSYKTARETFAAQSKPINQMAVGQFLEGKLKPALGEESARLRATGFAGAMENAPGTIKRATGEARFEKLSEVLTPDQLKILEDVKSDLARSATTELQAKAARGSGPNVNLLGTEAMAGARFPGFVNNVTTLANDILRRMKGSLDQKLAIELATEMLDPASAATAIEKAMARQAKGQKLADPFQKAGRVASKVLRTPAAVNMLAPQEEVQNSFVKE